MLRVRRSSWFASTKSHCKRPSKSVRERARAFNIVVRKVFGAYESTPKHAGSSSSTMMWTSYGATSPTDVHWVLTGWIIVYTMSFDLSVNLTYRNRNGILLHYLFLFSRFSCVFFWNFSSTLWRCLMCWLLKQCTFDASPRTQRPNWNEARWGRGERETDRN